MPSEQPAGRTSNSNTGLAAHRPGCEDERVMMTRTTLTALWFGGGGMLAMWVAVSPNRGGPGASQQTAVQRQTAAREQVDLSEQARRLRERHAATALGPSTRNPFRFSAPKSAAPIHHGST